MKHQKLNLKFVMKNIEKIGGNYSELFNITLQRKISHQM